jgi:hypothetical protein
MGIEHGSIVIDEVKYDDPDNDGKEEAPWER